MENVDYKKVGLKCGLEIHQQLDTKKLFCNCPSIIRDDKGHFVVKRYLRALAGESGKIDAAALSEVKKKKYFLYEGYVDTTCLIELDEEPPLPMNEEALIATLQMAKLVNSRIVDVIRVMRKTVVDGSNTSGFQRTSLVGIGGSILDGRVGIESICVEEDACKIVEKNATHNVYNLSRLGIPLIELATAPDMKTPEEVAEVAEHIGMLMRSLPSVKRGLGTIRQDVNVSIKDGVRVEIKGAQDLKMIATIVEYEALRQSNLLHIFAELKKRKASVAKEIVDVTSVFKKTEGKVIKSSLDKKGVVLALGLKGFAGLTGSEVVPGRRYGSEMSDHAKLMGVKGLFHADELPKYGVTQSEKDAVFKKLGLDKNKDNFLLVAEEKEVANRALEAAKVYAEKFYLEKEVRQALPDGTSAFLRPMPGAARMYPETDVTPIVTDVSKIEVPTLLVDRIAALTKKFGIGDEVAKRLLRDGFDLEVLAKNYAAVKPSFIIDVLYAIPALLKKKNNLDIDMSLYVDEVLSKLNDGTISKDAVAQVVTLLAKGKAVDYASFKPIDDAEIKKIIKEVIAKNKDAPMGALMGQVMAKLGGKADGKTVMRLLQEAKK